MKKTIFALLAACFLFACSENNEPESIVEDELIPISFNVGFSKEITPLRSSNEISVSNLNYYVYNSNTGALYKSKSYNSNFDGLINDELPEGDYIFVFFGTASGGVNFQNNNIATPITKPSPFPVNPYISHFELGLSNIDIFYKKFNHKIEKGNEDSNQIVLDRIVGKIKVILEDVIPSEVIRISIEFENNPYFYAYSTFFDYGGTIGSPATSYYNISESDKVSSGYTISFLSFENINYKLERFPTTIKLIARKALPDGVVDTGQSLVATKVINNVDVLKNKTVIYRGKLFDEVDPTDPNAPAPASFSVSVNDTWGDEVNETF
jgi:hypothetical protein